MLDRLQDKLSRQLAAETSIPNWTAANGLLGDSFTVINVRPDRVEVVTPNAKGVQRIPIADFEAVRNLWPAYVDGKVNRASIRNMTRFSKYIISILHWMDDKGEGTNRDS